jgi:aspartate/methionine/tyrosine aminotransferase
MMREDELKAVVKAVEAAGSRLLLDETYREMAFSRPLPMAASLSPRAISVSSISKTYGVPGLRTGWLVTSDAKLRETFLAAKEQIVICGSTIDEELGARILERRLTLLPIIRTTIQKHLAIVDSWIKNEQSLEWVRPEGGVACFPRVRGKLDLGRFYRTLNEKHKTHVGPGHWFDMDRRYFRIGYGWPKTAELQEGLRAISASLSVA